MPFNSIQYYLFLPIVYLIFSAVGDRWRWCVLLGASCFFYAALRAPHLLLVLALVALSSYGFGVWMERAGSPKAKGTLLGCGIAANLLILVVMKYLPFLSENLNLLGRLLSPSLQMQPVPAMISIGVSYYVFQAISYLFDVYLEIEPAERHLGYFALYLGFFPKLLQGPIERAGDLIPQLRARYRFDYDNLRFGMILFTQGLFKKVVLADRLGLYVDLVYKNVHAHSGLTLLLATYLYAFQIYLDFSGYTDMAIGSARMFNIDLTRNFNRPYLATSVADFWRRWHITFSRWILDYVFKQLQMRWRDWRNRGTAAALIVAFLVSGIWHGASWGFVIWGGLHGFYMACSIFYKPFQKRLHKALGVENSGVLKLWQTVVTFNMVCFTWIFFRAATLEDATYVVTHLAAGKGRCRELLLSQGGANLLVLVLASAVLIITPMLARRYRGAFLDRAPLRWSLYYLTLFCVIFFAVKSKGSFIYFGF